MVWVCFDFNFNTALFWIGAILFLTVWSLQATYQTIDDGNNTTTHVVDVSGRGSKASGNFSLVEICQEKDISLTNVETYSELCQASKMEKAIFAKSLILNVSQGSFWIRFCNDNNDVMSQLLFFLFCHSDGENCFPGFCNTKTLS